MPHEVKQKRLAVKHVKRRCHRCHGSGSANCVTCNGTGRMYKGRDYHGHAVMGTCEGCFGTRFRRCSYCSGEGFA